VVVETHHVTGHSEPGSLGFVEGKTMQKKSRVGMRSGTRSTAPSKNERDAADMLLGMALVSETYAEEGQRYTTFLTNDILSREGWDKPRTESGEPAWLALKELELALESYAYAIAQRLSGPEWLFFLRKVPWFIAGLGVPNPTEGYATAIAESISALSATCPVRQELPSRGSPTRSTRIC
jgi:hypothetical protein